MLDSQLLSRASINTPWGASLCLGEESCLTENSRHSLQNIEKGATFLHCIRLNKKIERKRKLHHLNRPGKGSFPASHSCGNSFAPIIDPSRRAVAIHSQNPRQIFFFSWGHKYSNMFNNDVKFFKIYNIA